MAGEAFIIGTTNDLEVIRRNGDMGDFVLVGIIEDKIADHLYREIMDAGLSEYGFESAGYGVWMKGFTKQKLQEFFDTVCFVHPYLQDSVRTAELVEHLDEGKWYFLLFGEMFMVAPVVSGLIKASQDKPINEEKNRPISESTNNHAPAETCCMFSSRTVNNGMARGASEVANNFEVVEDFGGEGEGYSWGDGRKQLCRCRNCGALFLNYRIKFLAMTYDSDSISYSWYLPVASRVEALEFMDKYIGISGLSDSYEGRKIWFDGSKWLLG